LGCDEAEKEIVRASAGSIPVEEAGRGSFGGEENDGSFAVGVVGITGEVITGMLGIAGTDTGNVSGGFDAFGFQQVLDDVVAGFIDIGIDAVGREIPGFGREADADIAADLSDPDGASLKKRRRKPEAEVESFIDGLSDALEGDVLAASEEVEGTDGGVAVIGAEEKCLGGAPATGECDRFRFIPASDETGDDDIEFGDDDQIDWIAGSGCFSIGGRLGHGLESGRQFGDGAVLDRLTGEQGGEIAAEIVGGDAGYRNGKDEIDVRRNRRELLGGIIRFQNMMPGGGEEADVEDLGSGLEASEDVPANGFTRRDGAQPKRLLLEQFVHITVGEKGGEEFGGESEKDQVKEEPAQEAVGGESFENREVVESGGFEGGEVFGIDADDAEPQRGIGTIGDFEIDGLDAASRDGDSEEAFAFSSVGDGGEDIGGIIGLPNGSIQMRGQ